MFLTPMFRYNALAPVPSLLQASRLFDELERVTNDPTCRRACASANATPTREPGYTLRDSGEAIHITMELPGVAPEDLSVEARANSLAIKAIRRRVVPHTDSGAEGSDAEAAEKADATKKAAAAKDAAAPKNQAAADDTRDDKGSRKAQTHSDEERANHTVYAKQFRFRMPVDPSNVSATLRNGLLEVVLRRAPLVTRSVAVNA